jgi:hypothetical protein
MIARALERTASLWPDVEQAYRFVHAVAHWLGNPQGESAAMVRRRVNGVLGAMQRHRAKAGTLAGAIDHFQKVTRSYRSGLFHTYSVPDLPRTNNDLEHLFGSQRYHERRATGRKTASPSAVLRGSVRLIAATATRVWAPSARELGAASREHWSRLRQRLEKGRQARTLRTRFRQDPDSYLAALEQQPCQLALPS